ncbi:hypothetical protein E8E13_001099 [Curvularia kusanoi]|uniref:Uncharacterized protein n=1 Tax=Curvularia kusanoi TaxID=90978 RepID=A0A9P4T3K4_CURKU|nr:hypothetical protein E8E13_001099 [Curvularia kusanoi]
MYPLSELLPTFKTRYAPLTAHESAKDAEEEPSIERWQSEGYARRSRRWIVLSGLLAILNIVQLLYPLMLSSFDFGRSEDAFSKGFATDFEDARQVVHLEQRNFTGWISYNATEDDVYRVMDPNEPQYFGPPSKDMDAAWDDLLYGQYVAMTREEAARYPGIVTSGTTGKYHMQ